MFIQPIHQTLGGLSDLLMQLNAREYTQSCESLSGATIGEHTRHIIELFQCLLAQYDSGTVNYELRQRDHVIQTDIPSARQAIDQVLSAINKPNKTLELQHTHNGQRLSIRSNYHRELLYNLEHCIHHQALIKVALLQLTSLTVDEQFGVAPSTLEYRKQCVR